jgi:hypothetical protein
MDLLVSPAEMKYSRSKSRLSRIVLEGLQQAWISMCSVTGSVNSGLSALGNVGRLKDARYVSVMNIELASNPLPELERREGSTPHPKTRTNVEDYLGSHRYPGHPCLTSYFSKFNSSTLECREVTGDDSTLASRTVPGQRLQ